MVTEALPVNEDRTGPLYLGHWQLEDEAASSTPSLTQGKQNAFPNVPAFVRKRPHLNFIPHDR